VGLLSTRAERVAEAQRLRAEGLLLREIAERVGSKVKTVHSWLSDPDLSRLRARHASYGGVCNTCGGPTTGTRGIGKAPERCAECQRWAPEAILEALRDWSDDHGGIPPRCDDVRKEGRGRLPSVHSVERCFGSWNAGLLAAGYEALHCDRRPETAEAILAAVRAGEPTAAIADRFGVTPAAIHERMKARGTTVRRERAAA
jgi:hypothetical protein